MTESEYRERVRRLLEQLQQIGYGTMNEAECRRTIDTGVFYYGGYEWLYNYRSGLYEMGGRSDHEPNIPHVPNTNDHDSTQYDTTQQKTTTKAPSRDRRPPENISKNRGDQPPQVIDDDYDESEEIEPTPAPVPRPTQPPQPRPVPVPPSESSSSSHYEEHRQHTQETVAIPVPSPSTHTEYKKSYHRKETVYTQAVVRKLKNLQYD